MIYEPGQKNRAADFTTLALFVSAAVLVAFSKIKNIWGPGVLQTLALICFGLMIYFLVRFRFTRYRYEIGVRRTGSDREAVPEGADEGGILSLEPKKLDFSVHKSTSSGRFVTECVISLADIRETVKLPMDSKEKRKAKKEAGAYPTFRYVRNMVGAEEWLIVARTDTGLVKIIIEPDEKLADYLSAVAGYNKSEREKNSHSDKDC